MQVNKKTILLLWKFLIVLILINYQVVTIILNDNVAFKYVRDILLILIFLLVLWKYDLQKSHNVLVLTSIFVAIMLGITTVNTGNLLVSIIFVRRYLLPIILLYLTTAIKNITINDFAKICRGLLNVLSVLSIWGIIQALFLGDSFLINLGYPTRYSYDYGRIILNDSFYFGGIGLQRFVSTICNSNVAGLIWGVSIILFLFNTKIVLSGKMQIFKFGIVCLAYILTFSRANILAMLIVTILIMWKYIPRKYKKILTAGCILLVILSVVIMISGNPIINKILGWIVKTFAGKESSSSMRTTIWATALKRVLSNPLGLGFGHVGSFAQTTGVSDYVFAENSYLAIAIDMGWIGLITYLTFLIALFRKFGNIRIRIVSKAGKSILIYMMICFMFSNHIYDMEATAYIYAVLGLLISRSQAERLRGKYNENVRTCVHV